LSDRSNSLAGFDGPFLDPGVQKIEYQDENWNPHMLTASLYNGEVISIPCMTHVPLCE
jgi:hypothetical protein